MTITLLLYYSYLLTKYKISSSGSHSVDISFVRFVVSQPYLVECVPQPRTLPRGPELCNIMILDISGAYYAPLISSATRRVALYKKVYI